MSFFKKPSLLSSGKLMPFLTRTPTPTPASSPVLKKTTVPTLTDFIGELKKLESILGKEFEVACKDSKASIDGYGLKLGEVSAPRLFRETKDTITVLQTKFKLYLESRQCKMIRNILTRITTDIGANEFQYHSKGGYPVVSLLSTHIKMVQKNSAISREVEEMAAMETKETGGTNSVTAGGSFVSLASSAIPKTIFRFGFT